MSSRSIGAPPGSVVSFCAWWLSSHDDVSLIIKVSPLDVQHLPELVHRFRQIVLAVHHIIDRFVCARNFVDDTCVLAGLNPGGLLFEIRCGELPLCRFAAPRLISRPAPCAQEWKLSAFPRPRTM